MSRKGMALGLTIGLGIGASLGFMYAPRAGEEFREKFRKLISDCFFKARWQLMSPEERYVYFWARSRRQRQQAHEVSETE